MLFELRALKDGARYTASWMSLSCLVMAVVLWTHAVGPDQRAIAQAIPVPAAVFNPYWAGYVATDRGPYTSIQASWTVPRSLCKGAESPNTTDFIWIGEGGYVRGLESPLIQAGTGTDCFFGTAQYHAFYEWYPGTYASDFPIVVQPGDTVTIRVAELRSDDWYLSVRDDTSGAQSSVSTIFAADTASADFVVERPNFCSDSGCNQPALNPFNFVTFQDVQLRTAFGLHLSTVTGALPIAMINPDTQSILAVPGRLDKSSGSMTVLWRHSR